MGPSEGGAKSFSQGMTGRTCSLCGGALVRVPGKVAGLLLLSSGTEPRWCKEPNTAIRPVEYQKNAIPMTGELNLSSEG